MNSLDSLAAGPSSPGYDAAFFERLFRVEDRHFWFQSRNHVIRTMLRQVAAGLPAGYRALEVGCGTGNVLRSMINACGRGSVVGMDPFAEGLRFAHRRTGASLVQGDLRHPPFTTRFHLIGLFDVLEHLPDDVAALSDLRELLAPGGALLITVPAFRSLWSYFDEVSCHFRRYQPDELESRLKETGFNIELLSPYMATLFPMAWLQRRLAGRNRTGHGKAAGLDEFMAQEFRIVPGLNDILRVLCQAESVLLARNWRLPLGTSLIAVARRA